MYKVYISIVAAFVIVLALPAVASAHVLKVDGHIGAVLHINPDDNPISGVPTDYLMSFSDDTGRFSLAQCDCDVFVIQDGKTIAKNPLAPSNTATSENHYTFPRPSVYTLRFVGTPKTPGAFQPFTLNYTVRVTSGNLKAQPIPLLLWLGMAMALGLILLAAFTLE